MWGSWNTYEGAICQELNSIFFAYIRHPEDRSAIDQGVLKRNGFSSVHQERRNGLDLLGLDLRQSRLRRFEIIGARMPLQCAGRRNCIALLQPRGANVFA
jgi:hypothetical protein